MKHYTAIRPEELALNPWKSFGHDWAVLAAGGRKKHNAMTVSWGGFGVLWGKPVVTLYLRPQRYTRGFIEKKGKFSLNFLKESEENRKAMRYIGGVSGRDGDKMKKAGLAYNLEKKTPTIQDAEIVMNCRVIYRGRIEKGNFINRELIKENYPDKDYHFVYLAEITECLVKDEDDDAAEKEENETKEKDA